MKNSGFSIIFFIKATFSPHYLKVSVIEFIYKLNQRIIELEKETQEDKKNELFQIITERDALIKERIRKILDGNEDQITYDY